MNAIVLLGLRVGMALLLYAFLGWALLLLWSDLKHRPPKTQVPIPALQVQIQIDDQEYVQHFTASDITIGRAPNCECFIDSKTVSTRHAQLSFHHGQWWAEDLNSTNGTLLNQEKLIEPTVVVPGDELRCGEALLLLQSYDQPSP